SVGGIRPVDLSMTFARFGQVPQLRSAITGDGPNGDWQVRYAEDESILDASIEDLMAVARTALTGTTDNATRVSAMVNAYFTFVEEPGGAFRLVFESDLANEPAVRQRVDAADLALAQFSAAVIAEDTGLSDAEALLLASGMQGMVQVAARRWLRDGADEVSRADAAELIASLSWRGISGFPLSHPPQSE
ncbi:MAG: hypothetical protein NTX29_16460, partial [Actinobacteria bacterium]|nr:hypothetical protein [Actinomycetota bacterium]